MVNRRFRHRQHVDLHQLLARAEHARTDAGRCLVGVGTLHIQRHRANLLTPLGCRPHCRDLPDGHFRRPRHRQLAVGRGGERIRPLDVSAGHAARSWPFQRCWDRRLPLRQPEGLNLDPSRTFSSESRAQLDRLIDTGPVVVTVEYRIAVDDAEAFRMAMHELKPDSPP